jgi:hypothetical protein
MSFSSTVKLAALQRAGGRCECNHPGHEHGGRCSERLSLATAQFRRPSRPYRHGFDGVANCEVLCADCGLPVAS